MQEQKKFRHIYNNQEVSREEFGKLAGDSFKWFDGDSIVSVPFSSFDSFFNGDYRSNRQVNDHLKGILNGASTRHKSQNGEVYKEIVGNLEDDINNRLKLSKKINKESIEKYKSLFTKEDKKCFAQCFCDGSCKKPQEKNTNSTRHKSQAGETHKELDLVAKDWAKKISDNIKSKSKDDVITNSNRGEKETMEYLQGVKESQSVDKAPIFTYCKVNKNALEALSLRALYGHIKYKETDSDWQNFTRVPNALEEYANASFRHALGIGEEDEETHLVAEAWNAVAKLEVFLRNKLNKS